MTIEILDPTYGTHSVDFGYAPRVTNLDGASLGIVSNGKQGTRPFFDALERDLIERHGVAQVVRVTKSNYSAPAHADIMDAAKQWQALVAGVGD